jgi:hypothetical protein
MSRRPRLPGAAELFRVTGGALPTELGGVRRDRPAVSAAGGAAEAHPAGTPEPARSGPARSHDGTVRALRDPGPGLDPDLDLDAEPDPGPGTGGAGRTAGERRRIRAVGDRRPTGRERHDEKITVYCSPEELLDLEHARLLLRAEHGLAVDRGRIVREALAVVLADLESRGEASVIVRRLQGR